MLWETAFSRKTIASSNSIVYTNWKQSQAFKIAKFKFTVMAYETKQKQKQKHLCTLNIVGLSLQLQLQIGLPTSLEGDWL